MKTKIKKQKSQLMVYFTAEDFIVADDTVTNLPEDDVFAPWIKQLNENKYKALFHLGCGVKEDWFSPALLYLYSIADTLIQRISRQSDIEFIREEIQISLEEEDLVKWKEEVPFVIGMEYVSELWLRNLWEQLSHVFSKEIREYEGTVTSYFAEHHSHINVAGRVFFHLVESKDEEYPFAFMATYSTKPIKSKKAIHAPLKEALTEFEGDQRQLLSLMSTVTQVAESSSFISDLMESGELFLPLKLSVEEAYTFLKETHLYEGAGVMCRVPDWWKKRYNSIKVQITVGDKAPSRLGLESIMDFSPSFMIDDESISPEELKEFLAMAEGMVNYKGKWIEINHEKLAAALNAFEKITDISNSGGISFAEAIRMELNANTILDSMPKDMEVIVSNGDWFRKTKDSLVNPESVNAINHAPSFKANLRPYQESGYQWLYQMTHLGLGACLADDMGLGKTVQIIAFLEYIRVNHGGRVLLVLPTSLIGNWQKEIEKFAPEMPYCILHKSAGMKQEALSMSEDNFLYITTYGMAGRLEMINEMIWDYVILDEAQAIKNAGTKQSKVIKAIPARMRIAMTGTPIENNLGDLWSLFDFLNQGLLGSAREFNAFTKQLNDDITGYAKLRKMIQPFILRRVKTDKHIIADLPDKIEIKQYADLSNKQVILYKRLLKEIATKLNEAEGIERKGLVLASIMKFKQICNHPDQYLGREEYKLQNSGKFEQLQSICETIYEKRERVIVFTQFKEMTEPIADFLSTIFQQPGLVLHGGTSVKRRNEMVEQFNGAPYVPFMVLSLKAGGVGLNLTSANHVIHFDRWWNPAIENQATDRAFRIGQTKNVMVYKFVTKGTIEEKIDQMIEEKQKLAGELLASTGEQWITELNNEELLQLFRLGGEEQ